MCSETGLYQSARPFATACLTWANEKEVRGIEGLKTRGGGEKDTGMRMS